MTAGSTKTKASTKGKPTNDPFGGDFSQARSTTAQTDFEAVLQWHIGLPSLEGDGGGMKIYGGVFIDAERVLALGLNPDTPPDGFERVALRLGGKMIPGWGASRVTLAVLKNDFVWEDRETGRKKFPPQEYESRKAKNDGSERELRGRTRALVWVKELYEAGLGKPILLSVRGEASAAINKILRDLKRMAEEATRLRRRAGHSGEIPREAFGIEVYASAFQDLGSGANTSRGALPCADIPADVSREFLLAHLLEDDLRKVGGAFDVWSEQYKLQWETITALPVGATNGNGTPPPFDNDEADPASFYLKVWRVARQRYGEQYNDSQIERWLHRHLAQAGLTDPSTATEADWEGIYTTITTLPVK